MTGCAQNLHQKLCTRSSNGCLFIVIKELNMGVEFLRTAKYNIEQAKNGKGLIYPWIF
jgi:hypothetical protein